MKKAATSIKYFRCLPICPIDCLLCRYDFTSDTDSLQCISTHKITFASYRNSEPQFTHSEEHQIDSYLIRSSPKPNIAAGLLKASLFVLCHTLVPLSEVHSFSRFNVLPATVHDSVDNTALLEMRDRTCVHVKGSPSFAVNSPGVSTSDLDLCFCLDASLPIQL
jgi:hypothetical protein